MLRDSKTKPLPQGNGSFWSGPKLCCDVCLSYQLLAGSERHIS